MTIALITLAALGFAAAVFWLVQAALFARFVHAHARHATPPDPPPRVAVIIPCKGIDERLGDTIRHAATQSGATLRVVCAFESRDDPAWEFVGRIAAENLPVTVERVVSRPTTARSQKIENLLAAIDYLGNWPEIYAFLDSDAVPPPHWLADLIAPLADPQVGATTGYRWYPPEPGLLAVIRCVWNAAALTYLGDHARNFCWGGSMALTRETFERLDIRTRWAEALSEDFQAALAVRSAGLRVVFVPTCLLPSFADATFREFCTFARRQLVIARVCEPLLWALIALFNTALAAGIAAAIALIGIGWQQAHPLLAGAGLTALTDICLAVGVRGLIRDSAVHRILPHAVTPARSFHREILAVLALLPLNLALVVASGLSRRFSWRGRVYEMVSPATTRLIGHR